GEVRLANRTVREIVLGRKLFPRTAIVFLEIREHSSHEEDIPWEASMGVAVQVEGQSLIPVHLIAGGCCSVAGEAQQVFRYFVFIEDSNQLLRVAGQILSPFLPNLPPSQPVILGIRIELPARRV